MNPVDILRKKRDGEALTRAEIEAFVAGVASRTWPDYQASALLMAVCLRGMTPDETAALTRAMVASGKKLDFSDLPGPKVDKHSTGGVGDKTSLVLAPLVAACGAYVPMMSGRGLGHTGGTLDKLESIPGFRVRLSLAEFRATLAETGCALIGPTDEIAPADKILYALRDVTSTVESIPLITASILSKKIAEGIDALVMDVKCGRGAFMKSRDDARALARSIVANGEANGVRTQALLTDMESPLGAYVGNALEVRECVAMLRGEPVDARLAELSLELSARMLALVGVSDPRRRVEEALRSGAGLEKLRQVIARQGGDPRIVDEPDRLPTAPKRHALRASRSGYVASIDALALGRACMALGAGRTRVEDAVDPAVGAVLDVRPGSPVSAGDRLVEVHYRDEATLATALPGFAAAFVLADAPPAESPLVFETLSA